MHLSPIVGSVLLLSVTLFLLFRMQHRPGSWRFPIAIGITFWLWAMTDEWFFLGPLALGLVLLGELLQGNLGQPAQSDAPEPLGPLPDVPTLGKALGIGILACMLTPHHIRIWELPFELVGAKGLDAEIRFRQLLMSPLSMDYWADTPLGQILGHNLNGVAYALLFVGGGAALGFSGSRLRFAHLALWVGFAVLSLMTMYAIPFLAVVAVPIVAGQLNMLSSRFTLKTWGDPKTRFLLLGSGGGRVFALIAALTACVLAWPGWMHPASGNEAYTRRVGWGVEPDAGAVKGAEQLQAWRAGGQLPAESRGLILSLDLANYCAWYAPLEKVYVNARYNHHRPELSAFVTVRTLAMGLVPLPPEQRPPRTDADANFEKSGIEYVVIHSTPGENKSLRDQAQRVAAGEWADAEHWSPWYLDGRSAVCGWRSRPGAEKPTFAAMRFDPLVLAFGLGAERLPSTSVKAIPASGGWEESFLHSPRVPPPGADEALAWMWYKEAGRFVLQLRQEAIGRTFSIVDRLAGGGGLVRWISPVILPALPVDDTFVTAPYLALRAARRAIAADPDHPDGYYALAQALSDGSLHISEAERTLGQITALRQCLKRLPAPSQYRPGVFLASPTGVAIDLTKLYLGQKPQFGRTNFGVAVNMPAFAILSLGPPTGFLQGSHVILPMERGGVARVWVGKSPVRSDPQVLPTILPLDIARETLQLAIEYVAIEGRNNEEATKQAQQGMEAELQQIEKQLAQAQTSYERAKQLKHQARRPDRRRARKQPRRRGAAHPPRPGP